jgi:hypothetical protein
MLESSTRPRVTRGWPLEAFVGDTVVCTLEGDHLDQVDRITVEPVAKGIHVTLGDPLGQLKSPAQATAQALTVTFEIQSSTYPGEKRILVHSPAGTSDPLPFLVML